VLFIVLVIIIITTIIIIITIVITTVTTIAVDVIVSTHTHTHIRRSGGHCILHGLGLYLPPLEKKNKYIDIIYMYENQHKILNNITTHKKQKHKKNIKDIQEGERGRGRGRAIVE
jgi:hypothetical protein